MTETDKLLVERGRTHGDYTVNAQVCQDILGILQRAPSWGQLSAVQRETLWMVAHKMARIVGGDPNHQDHWDDIAGYAKLASDRVPRQQPVVAPVRLDPHTFQALQLPVPGSSASPAVPATDSSKHALRLRRQVNHSELMDLPREDQLRYRFVQGEQSYILQPGRVVKWAGTMGNLLFLPERPTQEEYAQVPLEYKHWYSFSDPHQYYFLNVPSDD